MLRSLPKRVISSARTQLFINNQWVNSKSRQTFKTINPYTEEVIAEVQQSNEADVDIAVKAARTAFDKGPWRRMSGKERGNLILKLSDLIADNFSPLSTLEIIDSGKPIKDVTTIDLPFSIDFYKYYAGLANNIRGKTIPITGPYTCYTRYEPVGVCAQIIPWNYPLMMQCWKMAPALAAGCTLVLKPAEQTPLTALKLGELIIQAGFPEGVINILPGYGDVGRALTLHPGVDKVAFTGSTEVGCEVMRNSGTKGLKRISLECGGKSPHIIFDDCDMECAVACAHFGVFGNMGQSCIAGTRVYVHEKIYDQFIENSVYMARARLLGDPMDIRTHHGPQVDQTQMEKILGYIEKGKSEGAKLVTGGNRWGNKGYFVEPTIFTDVKDEMTIAKEEIFGPVMSILKFKDINEVISRANNSKYGLGAGVQTMDIEKALKVTNAMKAGTVYVNCYDYQTENTPFGGYKQSGFGRELGEDGLYQYLECKTVIIKNSADTLP
ncbi:unnamed protein product [Blepharisma stoltei]|uniref:Aldehyde dehydrogenase domain-containing protein n=1 Tax=Blepharisma stoltei TaxID=1481888 RepID=A0AAU9JKT4_9CILI|nr:unnamed protein product [Blepharisma stoltei]